MRNSFNIIAALENSKHIETTTQTNTRLTPRCPRPWNGAPLPQCSEGNATSSPKPAGPCGLIAQRLWNHQLFAYWPRWVAAWGRPTQFLGIVNLIIRIYMFRAFFSSDTTTQHPPVIHAPVNKTNLLQRTNYSSLRAERWGLSAEDLGQFTN